LNNDGIFISQDIIIDESPEIAESQYSWWKSYMVSQGEDAEFWYQKHMDKDYPVTLSDHFAWLEEAGFVNPVCQWRLHNFAVTTAERWIVSGAV
jgi:hypothetical protein